MTLANCQPHRVRYLAALYMMIMGHAVAERSDMEKLMDFVLFFYSFFIHSDLTQ